MFESRLLKSGRFFFFNCLPQIHAEKVADARRLKITKSDFNNPAKNQF